jgi:hypothetical protein
MYRLQLAGCLGNSLPQYMSLGSFLDSLDSTNEVYPLWGVRFLTPGDTRTKFNLSVEDLGWYIEETLGLTEQTPINISPMLDGFGLTFWGQVWDSPGGWGLWYVDQPRVNAAGMTWRQAFGSDDGIVRHADGSRARLVVRQRADENSYNDIQDLFDRYPGHVIEFSCFNRCIGTFPGRNTVVWEVRAY